jgi:hypothetical protein
LKYVYYSGAEILTNDVAADALMRYAAALTLAMTGDAVDLPAIDEHGFPAVEPLLVGPESGLVCVQAPDDALELGDVGFAAELDRRGRALTEA